MNYIASNPELLDKKDNDGMTALIWTTMLNNKDIVEVLIQNNANIGEKNKYGNTALMIAAYDNYLEIVDLLIKDGREVGIHNKNTGKTALIIAAEAGHDKIVICLLKIMLVLVKKTLMEEQH